jgi:hypothetical protein
MGQTRQSHVRNRLILRFWFKDLTIDQSIISAASMNPLSVVFGIFDFKEQIYNPFEQRA